MVLVLTEATHQPLLSGTLASLSSAPPPSSSLTSLLVLISPGSSVVLPFQLSSPGQHQGQVPSQHGAGVLSGSYLKMQGHTNDSLTCSSQSYHVNVSVLIDSPSTHTYASTPNLNPTVPRKKLDTPINSFPDSTAKMLRSLIFSLFSLLLCPLPQSNPPENSFRYIFKMDRVPALFCRSVVMTIQAAASPELLTELPLGVQSVLGLAPETYHIPAQCLRGLPST